jgi:ribonuclease T1
MKRTLTRWLAPLLALTLLLTACGGPGSQPPQSASAPTRAEEERVPSAPSGSSESPSLEEAPGTPASDTVSSTPEDPSAQEFSPESSQPEEALSSVTEDGWYNTKEEVAEYLHLYQHLPGNYKTKKEAQDAGWSGGSVERYTGEGTAIGGDRFGNREGLLPKAKDRQYTECDIDTVGKKSRGAKRIIFSNDGLVYYTEDHYNTFELLYGEEER